MLPITSKDNNSQKESLKNQADAGLFEKRLNRLKSVLKVKSESELAKILNIRPQSIAAARKRGQFPTGWIFQVAELAGVSSDWLFFGTGPVRRTVTPWSEGPEEAVGQNGALSELDVMKDNKSSESAEAESESGHYGWVPMVEARFGPDGESLEVAESRRSLYAFRKGFLRRVASSPGKLVMMRISGDSMEPHIQDGGIVMIDLGRCSPRDGCIFAMNFDDVIVIRELELLPGGMCRVISRKRSRYESCTVSLKDICIVGQVIWSDRIFPR
ncbi:helix-turn-helix domain-containing protein [Desulfobotulus sp. H1]|uniref:Helix-turn-helix domain-containing protein n=1 Tax=Desulfobotulus pelophilus TaxID=2823377 RepID=A0ABT3NC22_9BACT|nr:LexA family transcriptional regulator [Desulfobotulus pelophilus]MCW7755022.1 helix-turn-helix domain-containing protein [Desulfobotulus pelophilus]